jgi:hypothetical protein
MGNLVFGAGVLGAGMVAAIVDQQFSFCQLGGFLHPSEG